MTTRLPALRARDVIRALHLMKSEPAIEPTRGIVLAHGQFDQRAAARKRQRGNTADERGPDAAPSGVAAAKLSG